MVDQLVLRNPSHWFAWTNFTSPLNTLIESYFFFICSLLTTEKFRSKGGALGFKEKTKDEVLGYPVTRRPSSVLVPVVFGLCPSPVYTPAVVGYLPDLGEDPPRREASLLVVSEPYFRSRNTLFTYSSFFEFPCTFIFGNDGNEK